MRTHLVLALAFAGLLAPLAFVGCTAPVDSEGIDEDTAAADGEFTVRYENHYYTIRKNTDCKVRLCTGYFIKEVNTRFVERHVDSLKFLDTDVESLALAAEREIPDGGLVLYGRIGPKVGPWEKVALIVKEAYRGMPGEDTMHGDGFYRIHVTEHPYWIIANELNQPTVERLVRLDVTNAVQPYVEHEWLRDRVIHHGAIVAGHMHHNVGALDVNQVYLALPDERAECAPVRTECGARGLAAYTRDADRCQVFDTCMPMRGCPLPLPGSVKNRCGEGYTQVGWAADVHGCVDFACEPDFIAH